MNNIFLLLLITLYKLIKYNHTVVIKLISYKLYNCNCCLNLSIVVYSINDKGKEFHIVIASGKKVLRYELILFDNWINLQWCPSCASLFLLLLILRIKGTACTILLIIIQIHNVCASKTSL